MLNEDRFFSSVFIGSGLLFLALLFVAAATAESFERLPHAMSPALLTFGQLITFSIMDTYCMRMAAVFMISTSTILLRTGVLSRWLSYLGYLFAILLLVIDILWEWMLLLFPLWVFLLSIELLVRDFSAQRNE